MYTVPATTTVNGSVNGNSAHHHRAHTAQTASERRFCPSMFCFTDEIVVRRVTAKADVWLLTDETDDHSWMMMGGEPTCPHCGTTLLP
jgi:hypothetical protein